MSDQQGAEKKSLAEGEISSLDRKVFNLRVGADIFW